MSKKILLGLGAGFVLLLIVIINAGSSLDVPQPQVVAPIQQAKEEVKATTTSVQTPAVEKKVAPVVDPELYSVVKVVDGDTVEINRGGKTETLRLIGMDTPETVDPRKSVQCFGKEASNKAKELLVGRKVKIEADPSQGTLDKYGRTLAYIYRDDGLFYNKYMIEQGYAHEYTYNTPYKYQAEFKAAQKSAEAGKLGLWSPQTCSGNTTSSNTAQPTIPTAPAQTTQPATQSTSTGDKDCKDFKTQAEAQAYFNSKGGSSTNNVDRLDGSDHDGKVCENLP